MASDSFASLKGAQSMPSPMESVIPNNAFYDAISQAEADNVMGMGKDSNNLQKSVDSAPSLPCADKNPKVEKVGF